MRIDARLRLFDGLRLTPGPAPQAPPVPLTTADLQMLLAYLALHPSRPLERDRVAFTLWAEASEAEALRNLRQNLHRLRRLFDEHAIPDVIAARGRQLEFKPGLWVDVHRFEAWVSANTHPYEAIDLYQGDLLAGVGWANEASWVEPMRARLRESFLRLLRTQISAAMMRRNHRRALTYATRLIEVGPLRESSHRIYMEALYFNGRRADALTHYDALVGQLLEEFSVGPMPETRKLAERIAEGSISRDLPPTLLPPQNRAHALGEIAELSRSFVGRRAELQKIDEHFGRALAGHGSLVVIEGTDGTGKTRLLDTWCRARAGGMLKLHVRASRGGDALPRALHDAAIPWEVFPPQFPQMDAIRRAAERGTAPLPEVGRFLLTLAARAEQVVTLALDDLHAAGERLWSLLAFLAHRAERLPLLLLVTLNPERLPSTREHIMREARPARLRLKPLSPSQVTQLAHVTMPVPVDGGFTSQLYRLSEGNPFVATAYLDQAVADVATAFEHTPPAVIAWVSQRFEALPRDACRVMKAAAGVGRHVAFFDIQHAAGLPDDTLLDGLDGLLHHGIMREVDDGYAFTHEQFYRAALALT